jgi:competence protein ComEC
VTTVLHVLNVSRGSRIAVEHPSGRRSMIDINIAAKLPPDERLELAETNRLVEAAREEAALTHPVLWFREWFGDDQLFRFILSHPDTDHLLGIGHVLRGDLRTKCVWDLPHTKRCERFRGNLDRAHWSAYERWRRTASPSPSRVAQWRGSDSHWFGFRADYDHIEILWPTRTTFDRLDSRGEWNNLSLVLRLWHGGRSVLLPGDIEKETWRELATAVGAGRLDLRSDVLVASHHGRMTGYPPDGILGLIEPQAVIVSTDKLPAHLNAARSYARVAEVFATRWHGDLHIEIADDGMLEISSDRQRLLRDGRGFWYGFKHGA